MKTTRILSIVLIAGLVAAAAALATEKIAQSEDQVCTVCHDKPGSKLLTDQGKYYELMGSFAGYSDVKASFERCTSCHVRKPGSAKLTKKGEEFAALVGDMEGLREWVKTQEAPCAADDAAAVRDETNPDKPESPPSPDNH